MSEKLNIVRTLGIIAHRLVGELFDGTLHSSVANAGAYFLIDALADDNTSE